MICSLATLFLLLALTDAYKKFETICSKPSDVVNYVSSADTRSTLDILWSCVLTIVACTWNVQHLNVPEQREGRDPGWLGDIKWILKGSWTTTKWMLITIIAPELLLMIGWGDRAVAIHNLPKLQQFAKEDGVPWTLSHTLFADMGGFVIRSHISERLKKESSITTNTTTSKYANPFHLTASEILRLREDKIIEHLPYITKEELLDKSKGDNFVRIISIIQFFWMVIQIIARRIRHLAISQLEIGVLAFAICAVVIYVLNWQKPKGVGSPLTILQYEDALPSGVIASIGTKTKGDRLFSDDAGSGQRGSHILNNYSYEPSDFDDDSDLGFMIVGTVVFGAIHLAAWNFVFPTYIEQVLWRCSSMVCTLIIMVLLFGSVSLFGRFYGGKYEDFRNDFVIPLFFRGVVLVYVLARLFLLVEIFRTLCFLPPSAYIATWASNIPHLS